MIKIKYILAFIIGIVCTYAFIKLAPENVKYSLLDIIDIEIETTYEN